jgi:hypothetical protein
MSMQSINVPKYVADRFNQPSRHPSDKADVVQKSMKRIYILINEALCEISHPEWEIQGQKFHSPSKNEPYGIEFVDEKCCIYAEERGQRGALAIFKSPYLAADYFVWLVSGGTKQIDWGHFLDLEP